MLFANILGSLLFLLILGSHNSLAQKNVFTVMSYNVENLFDTKHDAGKQDYAYLPKAAKEGPYKDIIPQVCGSISNYYWRKECFQKDWNEKIYQSKLKNISWAMSYKQNGCGADIIFTQEVENIRVMKDLVNSFPKKCGYRYYGLLEGPDVRGIDIGFISRFKPEGHKLVDYPLQPNDRKRRSIYKVVFKIGGHLVTILGNHWPSLGTKDPKVRMIPAEILAEEVRKSNAELIIALGDFNTSMDIEPEVFSKVYETFTDAPKMGYQTNLPGTHVYRGHWGFLDHIFVAKKSLHKKAKIQPLWKSFYILNKGLLWKEPRKGRTGNILNAKDTPRRFNDKKGTGFSDHLPIIMSFKVL